MITHVQTALRKAGNYDKTGRARKNIVLRAFRVHRMGRRQHVPLGSSQAVTLRSN